MNIYALGDLHGQLPEKPHDADLVLLAGDICPDGTEDEQHRWADMVLRGWLMNLGCPVVAVAGNHDHAFYTRPEVPRSMPWTYPGTETSTFVSGLDICVWPYVPCERSHHWDLEERHVRVGSAVGFYRDRPEPKVLLCHSPPRGFGDRMNHDAHNNPARLGYVFLRDFIRDTLDRQPDLVLFGHCHESRGCWQWGNTKILNVTTGWNGSDHGRGHTGGKPHGWRKIPFENGVFQFLDGEEDAIRLAPGLYEYDRVGLGKRNLKLEPDGSISVGAMRMERDWRVRSMQRYENRAALIISGDREDTMHLLPVSETEWRGRWLNYERNETVLRRIAE